MRANHKICRPARLVAALACGLALPATAAAGDPGPGEAVADLFSGTSVLIEHSGSIGHGNDLSPQASRVFAQTFSFDLAMNPSDIVVAGATLSIVREVTPTDTTFDDEALLGDLGLYGLVSLPVAGGDSSPMSWSVGAAVGLPTSKASKAATLLVELAPSLSIGVEAPLLDGLAFNYGITPTVRLHRYTTVSNLVGVPCSPATGCTLGRTFDTGARNTPFQLVHDFGLSLSLWDSRLSVSTGLQLAYSRLYKLSDSPRYSEETLANPGNGGGSPTILSTAFTVDLGMQVHEGVAVSVGIWTPGSLRDDGDGYYNPLGNRYTQLYVDLVLTPVDGVAALVKQHRASRAEGTAE